MTLHAVLLYNKALVFIQNCVGQFLVFRLGGRVVMQRPAKPCTAVRFRSQPHFFLKI